MQSILEHILSTSVNRPLYESLWNLSISKAVKPNQKFLCENQCVADICAEINLEIHREDPNRSNFYYSTQITFGCLILYRHQIDKLYIQTKNALQSCTATFFEINWLSQISQHAPKRKQQKAIADKKKQNEPNKRQKDKEAPQKAEEVVDDFDLLEDIFKIPIELSPVAKKGYRKGKDKQPLEVLDPTMAISVNQITILEAKPTNFVRLHSMKLDTAEDDFGDEFGTNEKQLDLSFCFPIPQQVKAENIDSALPMELQDVPDLLRDANAAGFDVTLTLNEDNLGILDHHIKSRTRKASFEMTGYEESANNFPVNLQEAPMTLPELSLCEDIMEMVNKQVKSRIRRASVDLFARVEASKGWCEAGVNEAAEDNIMAPIPPTASSTPKRAAHHSSRVPVDKNETNFVFMSPISPIVRVSKPSAKKRKLCVDKVTEIDADVLDQNISKYQQQFGVPSPMESFVMMSYRIICSSEPYFTRPSSALKHGAEALLTIFKRNLKRAPKALKRPLQEDNSTEAIPSKKFRPTRLAAIKNASIQIELNELEVLQTLDPLEVPTIDDLAPIIPPVPELMDLFPEIEKIAPFQSEEVVRKPAMKTSGSKFKESDKWPKAKIMKILKSLWKQKVISVTMITLCPNTNRFVAAGVFFELMELSKLGAVELIQGEGLQLVDVKPGSNAKSYK